MLIYLEIHKIVDGSNDEVSIVYKTATYQRLKRLTNE